MAKNSNGRINIIENFDGKPSVAFVKYSDMSNDQLTGLIISGDSDAAAEYLKRKQSK
jgi:hypothetical protein